MLIRPARPDDIAAILPIYAHAVLRGTATFEIEVPDEAEMLRRYLAIREAGFPYMVAADDDGTLLGYAYAGPFRPRIAYRFTVENSVYVAPDAQKRGVGLALMKAIIAACEAKGCRQMVAVIGDSANAGSIALHRACGFYDAGLLKATGFKFGRWIDTVLMQRDLGEGSASPAKDA